MIDLHAQFLAVARTFGAEAAREKRALLVQIGRGARPGARTLVALLDALNFVRALPDDARVLDEAERAVERLRAWGRDPRLADTGFPGSWQSHGYSYAVLQRLVRLHPGALEFDWDAIEDDAELMDVLTLVVSHGENQGLEDTGLTLADWFASCRTRPGQTDLEFTLELLEGSGLSAEIQAHVYEHCDLPVRYSLRDPGTSRAEVRLPVERVHFQRAPIEKERFPLAPRIRRPFASLATLSANRGQDVIDAALTALCARNLEIFPLTYGNPSDVTLCECGRGVEIALVGTRPAFRSPLESLYFFLVLQNGVPIAYGPAGVLLGCCEMGINLFPEFRGGPTRFLYAQLMRALHQVLGVEHFYLTPYGMGVGNKEALESGAFWFYRRLGFVPANPKVEALARQEEERIRRDPSHRSDRAMLRKLSHTSAHFDLSRGRCVPLSIGALGVHESRLVAERFGGNRSRAEDECARAASRWLGVPAGNAGLRALGALLALIGDAPRWRARDRRALARLVRAKAERSEIAAARGFKSHAPFVAVMRALAAGGMPSGA